MTCIDPYKSLLNTVIPGWLCSGITAVGGKQNTPIYITKIKINTNHSKILTQLFCRKHWIFESLPRNIHTQIFECRRLVDLLCPVDLLFYSKTAHSQIAPWSRLHLIQYPMVWCCLHVPISEIKDHEIHKTRRKANVNAAYSFQ